VAWTLFGYSLGKTPDVTKIENPDKQTLVIPQEKIDDGAITITQGAYYGTYVDLEGSVRNELELITRYREMSLHPECSEAIEEIITEAVTQDDDGEVVEINMDKLDVPASIKKKVQESFNKVKTMLSFQDLGEDLFKRWYIDGRLYFQVVVDKANPREGVKELRYVDPRKIRKVREILKDRDPKTGVEFIKAISEYYVFNDRGLTAQSYTASVNQGTRIATDSIVFVPSGLLDAKSTMVIGWLHKAIKPLNQLRMIEDAIVIYRLSRAPERRIFYIDVGTLPKLKAEQYLKDIMTKYRNKLVYDANTGELRDERKHLSMLEDFWLPRREGSKGTEISTLPGGENLGHMEDVEYFQKKLYKSLNVPIGRLDSQQAGGGLVGLGRVAEITRDEVKFNKFIHRLRNKFARLFDEAMRQDLVLTGVCSLEEWATFRENISYDFKSDNNFAEMRDAELTRERVTLLGQVQPYIGVFYSVAWVKRHILHFTDEEIEEMADQIDDETKSGELPLPIAAPGMPAGMPDQQGGMPSQPGSEEGTGAPPPEDNTSDTSEMPETTNTPGLDRAVEKSLLGKRR
jgi:DNA-dependent RNA polymerase auxiliary subunit epsilon